MKRKVVLHGLSTLTISLPSSWANKFDIKKGDELEVEEHGSELRITLEKYNLLPKKQIYIKNLKKIGKSYISSSYRQGYEEIELMFDDPAYTKIIQEVVSSELIGFEVIKQDNHSCQIKDMTGQERTEYGAAIKRMWFLLLDLAGETFDAIKTNDKARMKNIPLMDRPINKFSNYCLRTLMKKNDIPFTKIPLHYYGVRLLEGIADKYKDLSALFLERKEKPNKEMLNKFSEVNFYLNELHKLHCSFNENKADELLKKIKERQHLIQKDNYFGSYLDSISEDIRSLIRVFLEINL